MPNDFRFAGLLDDWRYIDQKDKEKRDADQRAAAAKAKVEQNDGGGFSLSGAIKKFASKAEDVASPVLDVLGAGQKYIGRPIAGPIVKGVADRDIGGIAQGVSPAIRGLKALYDVSQGDNPIETGTRDYNENIGKLPVGGQVAVGAVTDPLTYVGPGAVSRLPRLGKLISQPLQAGISGALGAGVASQAAEQVNAPPLVKALAPLVGGLGGGIVGERAGIGHGLEALAHEPAASGVAPEVAQPELSTIGGGAAANPYDMPPLTFRDKLGFHGQPPKPNWTWDAQVGGWIPPPIGGGAVGAKADPYITPPTTPAPGLTRFQTVSNQVKDQLNKVGLGGVKANEYATPLVTEMEKIRGVLKTHGSNLSRVMEGAKSALGADERGVVATLGGQRVNRDIQDIAQDYSKYKPLMTPDQQDIMEHLRLGVEGFKSTLERFGIPVGQVSGDTKKAIEAMGAGQTTLPGFDFARGEKFISDPEGFFLPRHHTVLGDEQLPTISPKYLKSGGTPASLANPQKFDTMAQGRSAGYEYPRPEEAIQSFADDVAKRASEHWLAQEVEKLPGRTGSTRSTGAVNLYQTSGLNRINVPSDVADVINSALKKHLPADTGASRAYSSVNNTLRELWVTADASRVGIQSLLTAADNPKLAAKNALLVAQTTRDEGFLGKYIVNHDKAAYGTGAPTTTDMVNSGMHIAGSGAKGEEYRSLGGALEKVPGVGSVLKTTNRWFSDGGNFDRIGLFDALYDDWKSGRPLALDGLKSDASRDEVMKSIANAVNRATGYSNEAFGGSIGSATLFAPRFFQSQLETIAKAAVDGGIEGQVARRQLMKLAAIGTGLTVAANEARGYDTEFNPTDSNFLRIRNVGGSDVSVFGPWDSLVKGLVQSVPHPTDGGQDWTVGDPSYLLQTKLNPILSTAVSQIRGHDLIGNEVGDLHSVDGLISYARNLFMPISTRQVGAEPLAGTALGAIGVKSSPLTNSEVLAERLSEAGINPSDEDYLIKKREWLAANPGAVPQATGDFRRSQEIQQDIAGRRQLNSKLTEDDAQTLGQFRDNRSVLLQEQRDKLGEVIKSQGKLKGPHADWLSSYFQLLNDPSVQDPVTHKLVSQQLDAKIADWMNTPGRGLTALNFVQDYLGAGLSDVEKAYYNDLRSLSAQGYFSMPKYRFLKSGLTDDEIDKLRGQVEAVRLQSAKPLPFQVVARQVLPDATPEELFDVINSSKKNFQSPELAAFKADHRKELLWFNPNATWSTYTSSLS